MLDNIYNFYEASVKQYKEIKLREGRPPKFSIKSLPAINKLLWGLSPRKFVVVGARPGNGKSDFCLQLACDFAFQGHTVHFYSFEMPIGVCAQRILSSQCKIDNWVLRTGKGIGFYKNKIEEHLEKIKKIPLVLIEKIGNTLPKLKTVTAKIIKKPDIIIIDYGNKVQQRQDKSRKGAFDDYINGLYALAVEQEICVIMAAQIGRSVQRKDGNLREPELEDLKETGVLEEAADIVFLLHYPYTHGDGEKNEYRIRVAKNREGPTGYFPAIYYPEFSQIREREERGEKDGKTLVH